MAPSARRPTPSTLLLLLATFLKPILAQPPPPPPPTAPAFGGAGLALRFIDKPLYTSELEYRSLVVQNTFTPDIALIPNTLAQFDAGSTQQTFLSLSDLTMEAWVRPLPALEQNDPNKGCCWPVFGTLFPGDSAKGFAGMTVVDNKALQFSTMHVDAGDPCSNKVGSRSPVGFMESLWDGKWHHIALVYSSANRTKYYYYDGELFHSMACTSPLAIPGGSILVGTTADDNPKMFWEGDLDEIRLWNASRTQQQIRDGMNRVLTESEIARTVAYYPFDNFNATEPYKIRDRSTFKHDLVLGKTVAMTHNEDRLVPKVVSSSAPVWGANYTMDVVRQTNKFSGIYNLTGLVTGREATITIRSLFSNDTGVDILIPPNSQVLQDSMLPYSFPSTTTLQIRANPSTKDLVFIDKPTYIPLSLSTGESLFIEISVSTAAPIHSGSAGSALYCDGRSHAYAKDFSFGKMNAAPKYTVEFWAWTYFYLPLRTPNTVFSIGNSEISAPGPNNWCFGQKSEGVNHTDFCRGRLLVDYPAAGGYLDAYSGWEPSSNEGLLSAPAKGRFGLWSHVAVTGNGNIMYLYIDGVNMGNKTDYGFVPNPKGEPLGLFMCSWPFWGGTFHNFRGFIDEFRIWNRTRTQAEIISTMHTTIDASLHPDLLTYYKFDEFAEATDKNITDKLTMAKDAGAGGNDLVFGGCVPNRAPYCKNVNGTCSADDLPRVPCYTNTDEIQKQAMPTQYISSAPISGYQKSLLLPSNGNISFTLASSADLRQESFVEYIITTLPLDTEGGIYIRVQPTRENNNQTLLKLSVGSKVTYPQTLIFIPASNRGGDPLTSLSYRVESKYFSSDTSVSYFFRVTCGPGQLLNVNSKTCDACPYGTYSQSTSFDTTCGSYQNLLPSNATGMVLLVLNGIGCAITIAIAVCVVLYRKTNVMKAASPIFTYLILTGCLLGHAYVFTTPDLPNTVMCTVQPVLAALAYTLVLSNVAVKTYRIHYIFNFAKTFSKGSFWIKTKTTLLVSFVFLFIDGVLILVWFKMDPPTPQIFKLTGSDGASEMYWACSSKSQDTQKMFNALIVGYNAIITLWTLFLAMKVKNITDRIYNESKLIVTCIYNICVLSVILLPIIFMADTIPNQFRQLFGGIIVSLLCTGTAVILYAPKLSLINAEAKEGSRATWSYAGDLSNGLTGGPSFSESKIKVQHVYISLPGILLKTRPYLGWECVDLYVLPDSKSIVLRKVNQSVASYYEVGGCQTTVLSEKEGDYSLKLQFLDKSYILKVDTLEKFTSLKDILEDAMKVD
ncbi:Metabotropic glutamate receptor 3 [Chytridiales sp. JEL 0842]|nr:Metabotropic glutamate receptor 3 [Chytridiales sp. JEL 0842]